MSVLTEFAIQATHLAAHATFRPTRWFDIDAQVGVLSPSFRLPEGGLAGHLLVSTVAFQNEPY